MGTTTGNRLWWWFNKFLNIGQTAFVLDQGSHSNANYKRKYGWHFLNPLLSIGYLTSAFALRLSFFNDYYTFCVIYIHVRKLQGYYEGCYECVTIWEYHAYSVDVETMTATTTTAVETDINNVQLTVYVIVSCNDIIERKFAWWVFITAWRSHCYCLPLYFSQAIVWCYSLIICKVVCYINVGSDL